MIDRPLEAFTSSMPPAARACLRRGGGVACSFANPKYHPAGVVYCPAPYARSAHRSPGGAVAAAAGAAAADAAAARAASSGAPLQQRRILSHGGGGFAGGVRAGRAVRAGVHADAG